MLVRLFQQMLVTIDPGSAHGKCSSKLSGLSVKFRSHSVLKTVANLFKNSWCNTDYLTKADCSPGPPSSPSYEGEVEVMVPVQEG